MKRLQLRRFGQPDPLAPSTEQPVIKHEEEKKALRVSRDGLGLTPRQALFLRHYLKCNNASKAARLAGYSIKAARQVGQRLLTNAAIAAEISKRRARVIEKLDFDVDQALEELAAHATANMQDYFAVGEHGQPVLNWSKLTRRQASALQELTVEEFVDGRSDKRKVRRVKFKLIDKLGAIDQWAKMKGVYVEKHDHKHDHQHTVISVILDEIDAASRGQKLVEHQSCDGADE